MGRYENFLEDENNVEREKHRQKMAAIIERAFSGRKYSELLELSDETLRELYDKACKSLRGEAYEEKYDAFAIPDEEDEMNRGR